MSSPFISDGDNYVFNNDDDNRSVCENSKYADEGQYSIIRNEVRSTWPKRRPKYQKPRESALNESQLTVRDQDDCQIYSPLDGSISDIICRDVDDNINHLNENLASITQRLEDVSAERADQSGLHRRLLDENRSLRMKMTGLEAQHGCVEQEARQKLEQARHSNNVDLKRMMKNKTEQLEEMRTRLTAYEQEVTGQRISGVARKNEATNIQYEKERLEKKIANNDMQYDSLNDEFQRLKEITEREINIEKKELEHTIKHHNQLEMHLDLVHAQLQSGSMPNSSKQLDQLMQLINKRSHDNRMLQEEVEDVQAEILARSVAEGRSLLNLQPSSVSMEMGGAGDAVMSWASETDCHTKGELIDYIIKETEVNEKLRQYSDKLISRIIDVDASILEI